MADEALVNGFAVGFLVAGKRGAMLEMEAVVTVFVLLVERHFPKRDGDREDGLVGLFGANRIIEIVHDGIAVLLDNPSPGVAGSWLGAMEDTFDEIRCMACVGLEDGLVWIGEQPSGVSHLEENLIRNLLGNGESGKSPKGALNGTGNSAR